MLFLLMISACKDTHFFLYLRDCPYICTVNKNYRSKKEYMIQHGFVKVATASPIMALADPRSNAQRLYACMQEAYQQGSRLLVTPELGITGYSCGDLFQNNQLLDTALENLTWLIQKSSEVSGMLTVVGCPMALGGQLINAAVVIGDGQVHCIVAKQYLPNYKEFYEKRWFTPASDILPQSCQINGQTIAIGNKPTVLRTPYFNFGIEICEDLWSPAPPSTFLTMANADIIVNLSADTAAVGKHDYLKQLVSQQSARCIAGYIYSSCGNGESTTDVVFQSCLYIYENGRLLAEGKRFINDAQVIYSEIDIQSLRNERRTNSTFSTAMRVHQKSLLETIFYDVQPQDKKLPQASLTRFLPKTPFVPGDAQSKTIHCEEIISIQVAGLANRLQHIGCQQIVIGISGGLDSTLALLVCVEAFDYLQLDRKGIIGITMPGFGTTDRTYTNAMNLMTELGVTIREISIADACMQHFEAIGHDPSVHDITYENVQARERTKILMNVANQMGGIVIGTGDMSEMALGWATYNGDHMSMYAVNCSVPKTLVRHLVLWYATHKLSGATKVTLLDIADTPISPELIPADENGNIKQKTEDLVGPYILHDFFLYYFLRHGFGPAKIYFLAQYTFAEDFDKETILKWLKIFHRRFFQQQFKRSCVPDGPKVGSVSLSPRGDWRMPSDAKWSAWDVDIDV